MSSNLFDEKERIPIFGEWNGASHQRIGRLTASIALATVETWSLDRVGARLHQLLPSYPSRSHSYHIHFSLLLMMLSVHKVYDIAPTIMKSRTKWGHGRPVHWNPGLNLIAVAGVNECRITVSWDGKFTCLLPFAKSYSEAISNQYLKQWLFDSMNEKKKKIYPRVIMSIDYIIAFRVASFQIRSSSLVFFLLPLESRNLSWTIIIASNYKKQLQGTSQWSSSS